MIYIELSPKLGYHSEDKIFRREILYAGLITHN